MVRRGYAGADPAAHEAVQHGTTALPVACYYDDLNENCCPWHWHEELEAGVITEGVPLICAGTQAELADLPGGRYDRYKRRTSCGFM